MSDPTPLRIGIFLPTSRLFPGLDRDFMDGLRAGLTESGAAHTLFVEPVGNAAVQDTMTGSIQRLLLQHRPHVITGVVGSAMIRHVHMFFDEARVPFLVNSLGADPILDNGTRNPWVFHNSFNLWQSAYALGHWASQNLGSRACIAAGYHEAGYGVVPAFWGGFCEAGGGSVLATEVTHRATADDDPTEQIRRLADLEPDFVFALYSGREGISFARSFASLGPKGAIPVVSTPFMIHRRWLPRMGDDVAGLRTAFCWDRRHRNEADQRFREACQAEGCDDPDVFALLGYETGRALCEAREASRGAKWDAEAFRAALADASFTSPRGPWSLDPESGEVNTRDWLMEVRGNGEGATCVNTVESLPLPPSFRGSYDRFRSQELRPGWINPYLVT